MYGKQLKAALALSLALTSILSNTLLAADSNSIADNLFNQLNKAYQCEGTEWWKGLERTSSNSFKNSAWKACQCASSKITNNTPNWTCGGGDLNNPFLDSGGLDGAVMGNSVVCIMYLYCNRLYSSEVKTVLITWDAAAKNQQGAASAALQYQLTH